MRQLDRAGIFNAIPISWGIKRYNSSQSVALVIEHKILAQVDGDDLIDWTEYEDHSIVGYHFIVGKKGDVLQTNMDRLVAAIGWDGNPADILNDPPRVVHQITVEEGAYEGKTQLKVAWINPEGHVNSGVGGSDADVSQINAQFGSLLRAAAASARSKLPAHETKAAPPVAPRTAPDPLEQQMEPAAPLNEPTAGLQSPPAGADVGDGENLPF